MNEKLNICIIGLSITSSWGNGHATTFRSIVKGLSQRGHKVTFLERDKPWYANQRDLKSSPFCKIYLYNSLDELKSYKTAIEQADCVIVGSYVPDGISVGQWVQQTALGTVAFYDIDTPVTLAKLANNECDYLSVDLIPGYDLYLSFTGGPVLKHIEHELGSPKAEPFYCSFDPELYHPQTTSIKWDLGYMGTYSDDRQPTLNNLLIEAAHASPGKRFVVAGPQYPEHIKWPCNIYRIEHLSPDLHKDFYNSQKFTLNITRADMIRAGYSPSVRLFEAAGCATPIISDYWEGLETFFVPDEEILVATNAREVNTILEKMSETERKNLAAKAYIKVLSNHTPAHRAMQLEKYLNEINMVKQTREKQYN
jgi:spore maturation protein CgeB